MITTYVNNIISNLNNLKNKENVKFALKNTNYILSAVKTKNNGLVGGTNSERLKQLMDEVNNLKKNDAVKLLKKLEEIQKYIKYFLIKVANDVDRERLEKLKNQIEEIESELKKRESEL